MTELTERYGQALVWAHELHRTQARKGTGIPYVTHLLSVSALVLEHGGDEDQAIAALLHDSIEDQGVTDDQISAKFGSRVASIVRACTDADTQPKPPWDARKREYIDHLPHAPADALLVSLADKTHNARAIAADVAREGESYFENFTGKVLGTRWYYAKLAEIFESRQDELRGDGARADGVDLLAQYHDAIERLGVTSVSIDAYERSVTPA